MRSSTFVRVVHLAVAHRCGTFIKGSGELMLHVLHLCCSASVLKNCCALYCIVLCCVLLVLCGVALCADVLFLKCFVS